MREAVRLFFRTKILFLFFFLALGALFVLSHKSVSAQGYVSPQTPSYSSSRVDEGVPRNQHTHTQIVVIELISTIHCYLTGIDPLDPQKGCLGIDPVTRKISYETNNPGTSGGLIGLTTNLIGAMYVPPASSGLYINHMASNFGITKSAHAQFEYGTGFTELTPVLNMWEKVRNLAYLTLVFVFVIVGVAIMLRVHLDPRTVMTIQNQIPRIVVSLIVVTFSYAIVGLLVDFMWTTTYLGINVLTSDQPCSEDTNKKLGKIVTDQVINNPLAFTSDILSTQTGCFKNIDGITGIAGQVGRTIGDVISRTFLAFGGIDEALQGCDTGTLGWKLIPIVGGEATDCLKLAGFGVIKFLVGIIGFLIVFTAIVIALIRLWIMLLKSYIRILFYTILGPFWIIIGLIPGNSLGVGRWIRTLIANLAVFPGAVLMLTAAAIFASDSAINDPTASFVPPLVGHPNFADNVGLLIAFGLILLAPELINMLRDGLKTPPSKYGGALSGGLKAGNPLAVGQQGANIGSTMFGLSHLPGVNKLPLLNKIGKGVPEPNKTG